MTAVLRASVEVDGEQHEAAPVTIVTTPTTEDVWQAAILNLVWSIEEVRLKLVEDGK